MPIAISLTKKRLIGKFKSAQTDYHRLREGYVHIPQQTMFFRAKYWKELGPLDPSFYFAMDYDLWNRIAAKAPLKYLPGAFGKLPYSHHQQNECGR